MNSEISLKLFEITQEFIKDKKKARAFVSKIEETIDVKFEKETTHLATKEDIANVRTEIKASKADILKWLFAMFLPFYVGMIVFLIKQFM